MTTSCNCQFKLQQESISTQFRSKHSTTQELIFHHCDSDNGDDDKIEMTVSNKCNHGLTIFDQILQVY